MILIRTLGSAHIETGDSRITPQSLRKFALLLHLSAERGRRVPRGTLYDLMYPDFTAEKAGHSLRELVYQLRQSGVDVETDKGGVLLASEAVRSDYSEVIEQDRPDEAQIRAAEGGFLPGYAPSHSEAYVEWFEGWKARTTFEVVRALLRELERVRRRCDWGRTELTARACIALDAYNEEATLALAEALAIGGMKAQAVQLLDSYMAEIRPGTELRIPAAILKRRISERLPDTYGAHARIPLVGREREMALLSARLAATRRGEPQCVVLTGEPGIGKTRIIDEFCTVAALAGVGVERIAAQPHDEHRPLGAFMDLMPKVLNLAGALGSNPTSLGTLQSLTGAGQPSAEDRPLEASDARFFTLQAAILDVLSAVCDEGPCIIAVDDAHWLDVASLQVLARVLAAPGLRVLVLLGTRHLTGMREALRMATSVVYADVRALEPPASRKLIGISLRMYAGTSTDDLIERIHVATAGHPLFLTTLASEASSVGFDGDIQGTFADLIEERIERLSDRGRTTLLVASLLGRHCSLPRLIRSLDLPHFELLPALGELESHHFVQSGEAGAVAAPHALVSAAVLRKTSSLVIAAAHHRIADILRTEIADESHQAMLWDSAEHYLAAGDVDEACVAFRSCAAQAVQIGRPREAAQTLFRAIGSIPDDKARLIAEEAVRLAHAAGETEIVREGMSLLRTLGWREKHDDIELADIGSSGFNCADAAQRMAKLRTCMLSEESDTDHRQRAALLALVFADCHRDEILAAESFRVLNSVSDGVRDDETFELKAKLMYHSTFGDLSNAIVCGRQTMALANRLPSSVAADLQRKAGIGFVRAGRVDEAVDAWRIAYDNAERAGLKKVQFVVSLMLGTHYADLEEEECARVWVHRAGMLAEMFPEYASSLEYLGCHVDAAVAKRDYASLRKLYRTTMKYARTNSSLRVERWIRAMDALLRLVDERAMDVDHEVRRLTDHHRVDMETGDVSDFEVAVAVQVLAKADRSADACSLLTRYLTTHRHQLSPLWASLREAARAVGAWDCAQGILEDRRAAVLRWVEIAGSSCA